MRKLLATLAFVLTLSGCTAIQTATTPVNTVDLNKAAYTARATYVGALEVMAQIVQMPRCEKAPAPCIPQPAVDSMRTAELVGVPGSIANGVGEDPAVPADAATQAGEDAARSARTDTTALALVVGNATKAANVFKFAVDTYKGK